MKRNTKLLALLIVLLQLVVCCYIPLQNALQIWRIDREGTPYRFALSNCYPSPEGDFWSITFSLIENETDIYNKQIVPVIDVGADGLARIRETAVSYEDAWRYPYMPIGVSLRPTRLFADKNVLQDLQVLSQVMNQVSYLAQADESWFAADFAALRQMPLDIGNEQIRALAQKQIDEKNGDELFDSYATGVAWHGEIYLRDVYIAGMHIASFSDGIAAMRFSFNEAQAPTDVEATQPVQAPTNLAPTAPASSEKIS